MGTRMMPFYVLNKLLLNVSDYKTIQQKYITMMYACCRCFSNTTLKTLLFIFRVPVQQTCNYSITNI